MKTIYIKSGLRSFVLTLALSALIMVGHAQTTHHVGVTDYEFTPSQLEIQTGDTVVWTNTQGHHNVNGNQTTYPDNPESFGNNQGTGWTYTYVFHTPGTYDYQCDPHVNFGMVGQVIVSSDLASITIDFTQMNPHLGQDLWLALIDYESGSIIKRIRDTIEVSFSVLLSDIELGRSYLIDFFADHNHSGYYDPPPADHAWRLEVQNLTKDTTISFVHNTNFTNIAWQHMLTVSFLSMNPHIGQELWLNIREKDTRMEIARMSTVVETNFDLDVLGIVPGKSYTIDFFADHDGSGHYDPPPVDHAWRIDLDNASGDTTIIFTHNTNFTQIDWETKLVVQLMHMTPHVGQLFELYLYDMTDVAYVDTVVVESISAADFNVESFKIIPGHSYNIDFFADLSGNGSYDTPPVDHAWRIPLMEVKGDTTIDFMHNTSFTDIFAPTPVKPQREMKNLHIYPNPARNFTTLSGDDLPTGELHVRILNSNGQVVKSVKLNNSTGSLTLDINDLQKGTYFLSIHQGGYQSYSKMVKSE